MKYSKSEISTMVETLLENYKVLSGGIREIIKILNKKSKKGEKTIDIIKITYILQKILDELKDFPKNEK